MMNKTFKMDGAVLICSKNLHMIFWSVQNDVMQISKNCKFKVVK